MMTILITAYAVNPLKGSEDGMGWNYIYQAARNHKVIAVTRCNNRAAIHQYMEATQHQHAAVWGNINFIYFDWPKWMLFWKKGPMLSMIYFYVWQFTLALWLLVKNIKTDVVHNLNFHNDWTPSFLWMLGKPFAWGPVGHHPRIPALYLKNYGTSARRKDSALWLLKNIFWKLDPFLWICKKKADMTWCMHPDAVEQLALKKNYLLHPSVAAAAVPAANRNENSFVVLSVGRFVPLKGFDIAIRSFALFYKDLPAPLQPKVKLLLVGKGEYKAWLQNLAYEEGVAHAVTIKDWMTEAELNTAYQNAHAFLYPSYEGAGMVVAEAMRYRLPVVCWNNQGPGNIVHPESLLKIPYGIPCKSIRHFAGLLTALFFDKDYYQKEAGLAFERFESNLNWEIKARQLTTFYQQTYNNYHA